MIKKVYLSQWCIANKKMQKYEDEYTKQYLLPFFTKSLLSKTFGTVNTAWHGVAFFVENRTFDDHDDDHILFSE